MSLQSELADPRFMLVTTMLWPSLQWFAAALRECGANVSILCPRGHPAIAESDSHYFYKGPFQPITILKAIEAFSPDILIAGDDLVLNELLLLYRKRRVSFGVEDYVVRLIDRSFGNPEIYALLSRRTKFMDAARAAGIRVPETMRLSRSQLAEQQIERLDFPCVIKTDGSMGGYGTDIVGSCEDAAKSRRRLQWKHARNRIGAVWRGQSSVSQLLAEPLFPRLNAQQYIPGPLATSAFSCWRGELVGAVHVVVLQESKTNGSAAIVRPIVSPEMEKNAKVLAAFFRLSGMHGLDYVLDFATGTPILIEMNPRLVQIAHFNLGDGADPACGLVTAVRGSGPSRRREMLRSDVVTLKPNDGSLEN